MVEVGVVSWSPQPKLPHNSPHPKRVFDAPDDGHSERGERRKPPKLEGDTHRGAEELICTVPRNDATRGAWGTHLNTTPHIEEARFHKEVSQQPDVVSDDERNMLTLKVDARTDIDGHSARQQHTLGLSVEGEVVPIKVVKTEIVKLHRTSSESDSGHLLHHLSLHYALIGDVDFRVLVIRPPAV